MMMFINKSTIAVHVLTVSKCNFKEVHKHETLSCHFNKDTRSCSPSYNPYLTCCYRKKKVIKFSLFALTIQKGLINL